MANHNAIVIISEIFQLLKSVIITMVDVINFVCLHHLEESAHAQANQFSMTMEKRVKVYKHIPNYN